MNGHARMHSHDFRTVRNSRWPAALHGCAALLLAALLVCASAPALGQSGARVRPVNLAQMVDSSGVIIRGRVLSVKAEKHPQLTNLNTIVVTLKTEEVLKGKADAEFTFRQYVWDAREARGTLGFKVGEEVLLMLYAPSQYGLSSPVGFEQGRFRVTVDASGSTMVTNGWNNLGLMRGVQASTPQLSARVSASARRVVEEHRQGPIDYAQFKELVGGMVATQQ